MGKRKMRAGEGDGEAEVAVGGGGIPENQLEEEQEQGGYITEGIEGSGSCGVVFRVRSTTDGRKFAIKYPRERASQYNLLKEGLLLGRVGGKNCVIKYQGWCRSSDNRDCIVLKHVEHDRPEVLMKEITITEIQCYALCMFTALAHLHKLGVVHRDVKPGNILFSRKSCMGYLIDFDLAKLILGNGTIIGSAQKEGSCTGTVGFRAPEVLLGSIHQSPKLDVWSAGATLLYLLMGNLPFIEGTTEHNIIQIAKLRGSEQVLELAEMHGRQSSVPADLCDCPPMKLREWCKANTRRPDLMEAIPGPLLNLVDMCLAVDPCCRISAKEALKGEFLAPCVSALRKARLLRKHSH